MKAGAPPGVMPALNSVTTPLVVMRPIRSPVSANHGLPSGPGCQRPATGILEPLGDRHVASGEPLVVMSATGTFRVDKPDARDSGACGSTRLDLRPVG